MTCRWRVEKSWSSPSRPVAFTSGYDEIRVESVRRRKGERTHHIQFFLGDLCFHQAQITSFLHFTFLFYIPFSFMQTFVHLPPPPPHLPFHSNSSCTFLAILRHRRDMLSCLLSRGRNINYFIILVSCDTAGLQGFPATTRDIYQLNFQAATYSVSAWLEVSIVGHNCGVNSELERGINSRWCHWKFSLT
jgi:hypothetical protein